MQALDLASRMNESILNGNLKPRAYLEGVNIPASFQLPNLEDVRTDAAKIDEASSVPLEVFKTYTLPNSGYRPTPLDNPTRPLVCNIMMPRLFKWSYFVHSADVPADLLEPCLFALEMFLQLLEEAPESILRAMDHYLPGQDPVKANYAMSANCRMKIAFALMSPKINHRARAVPFLKKSVEEDMKRCAKERVQAWMINPIIFEYYGDALMSTDLSEAKLQLERALAGAEGPQGILIDNIVVTLFKIRVNLVAVLSQLGVDVQKRKSHEEWAVKYLRKNPFIIPEDLLRLLLLRQGFPEHPVLTTLGGPKWFEKRKSTFKNNERRSKMCRTCGVREPTKTLSVCAGCKYIWYCSKDCQAKNWKAHKTSCKEMAEERKKLELLKLANPSAGERKEDWIKWRTSYLGVPVDIPMHALGLHRDVNRGVTHILWYGVKYTPAAGKDIGQKFTIEIAGVFKIDDVLTEVEKCMNLNKGEGREFIDEILEDMRSNRKAEQRRIPYVFILVCLDGHPDVFLGSGTIEAASLRRTKHNPDWRKTMKKLPGPVVFRRTKILDQEDIF